MALICVGGVSGAPGASTTALGIAATWPNHSVVFVEADPDGGVLLVRYRMTRRVGLLSFAAAARHGGLANIDLHSHTQLLPGELRAMPAPDSPLQADAAMQRAGPALAQWLSGLSEDVVIDVGRIRPGTPSMPLIEASDITLLCARGYPEQLQLGSAMLRAIRERGVKAGWCLIGDGPHSAQEVERVYSMPVLGQVMSDRKGAEALTATRKVRRSGWTSSVRGLAQQLFTNLQPLPAPPVDAQVDLSVAL